MKPKARTKRIKILKKLKKYFTEMRETCDSMIEHADKELKRLK